MDLLNQADLVKLLRAESRQSQLDFQKLDQKALRLHQYIRKGVKIMPTDKGNDDKGEGKESEEKERMKQEEGEEGTRTKGTEEEEEKKEGSANRSSYGGM